MRTFQDTPFRLGSLMTRPGADVVGPGNYTRKRNVRRELANEVTREGDRLFAPNTTIGVGLQPYPAGAAGTQYFTDHDGEIWVDHEGEPWLLGGEPITRFGFLRHPNGQGCLVATTATTIYRYYALDDSRYFTDTGPDTPYFEETGPDTPYFNENPGEWIVIGSGYSPLGHRWEIEVLNGYAAFNNGIDLMVTYRWNEYTVTPMHELREAGVIAVGTIHAHKGVLLCGDITEFKANRQAEVMNGSDPYGRITDPELMNRVQYRIVWPGVGEPRRWAANVLGSVTAGSDIVTLEWPMASLEIGMEILVEGAGTAGGNLSTTIAYIEGTTLIIVDPAITTTVNKPVKRKDADALITGGKLLQGDGSPVLRILSLQGIVVVLKGTGIVTAAYTGELAAAFVWDEENYKGAISVFWRWVAINVRDDYILYAGADRFWRWDPATRVPREHTKLSLCSDLFFDHAVLADMENVWAEEMDVTGEIWIRLPPATPVDTILAYDYLVDECNTIDRRSVTAFATINRPVAGAQVGPAERWGVLGLDDGTVVQYGRTNLGGAIYERVGSTVLQISDHSGETWTDENGNPWLAEVPTENYRAEIEEGLFAPGGDGNEAKIGGYQPLPSAKSPAPVPPVEVVIEKFVNATATGVPGAARTVAQRQVDLATKPLCPAYAKVRYVRARISWTASDLRLSGRQWYHKPVPSKGAVHTRGAET